MKEKDSTQRRSRASVWEGLGSLQPGGQGDWGSAPRTVRDQLATDLVEKRLPRRAASRPPFQSQLAVSMTRFSS